MFIKTSVSKILEMNAIRVNKNKRARYGQVCQTNSILQYCILTNNNLRRCFCFGAQSLRWASNPNNTRRCPRPKIKCTECLMYSVCRFDSFRNIRFLRHNTLVTNRLRFVQISENGRPNSKQNTL